MANATKTTVEIPQAVIIPPLIKRERIVLELSVNEAETLGLLLARIAGDPANSRRGHCDAMRGALAKLGYGWMEIAQRLGIEQYTFAPIISSGGTVCFNDEVLDPSKD
jgi:hypothetical protein